MRDISRRFESFLRGKTLRLTRQRAEILRAIYATHKHVSADDLYELLRKGEATRPLRISRATVYRTLALLEEGGFVERLEVPTQHGTLYEHTLGHSHHDHMVCLTCGRIIEFADERLEALQDEVVATHGFLASSHRLNVYGTCGSCQKNAAASEPGTDREQAAG